MDDLYVRGSVEINIENILDPLPIRLSFWE